MDLGFALLAAHAMAEFVFQPDWMVKTKDRENRMEAEYITIGTLISFSWAIATSCLAWWLARQVGNG